MGQTIKQILIVIFCVIWGVGLLSQRVSAQTCGSDRLQQLETRLEIMEAALYELLGEQPEPDEVQITEAEQFSTAAVQSLAAQYESTIDSWDLPNFTGREVNRFSTRVCGSSSQNSTPSQDRFNNIAPTLVVLQKLRSELGAPINLTSVYRDTDYNACVGGVSNSQHVQNTAIDFYAGAGNPVVWRGLLQGYRGQAFVNPATGEPFIFAGGIGIYNTFVHVDTRGINVDWDSRG